MIKLRKVTFDDMDILYQWANDTDVRENSFNSEPIPYEDHKEWFDRIINDNTVYQFMLLDNETPVGQIRLNVEGDEAEIGYSIAREFRGKGYGHKILQLIVEEVRLSIPEINKLVAKVKSGNIASKKLFESEGYNMKYSCYALEEIGGRGITN